MPNRVSASETKAYNIIIVSNLSVSNKLAINGIDDWVAFDFESVDPRNLVNIVFPFRLILKNNFKGDVRVERSNHVCEILAF
jgi:hypothetical protein